MDNNLLTFLSNYGYILVSFCLLAISLLIKSNNKETNETKTIEIEQNINDPANQHKISSTSKSINIG